MLAGFITLVDDEPNDFYSNSARGALLVHGYGEFLDRLVVTVKTYSNPCQLSLVNKRGGTYVGFESGRYNFSLSVCPTSISVNYEFFLRIVRIHHIVMTHGSLLLHLNMKSCSYAPRWIGP